MEDAAAAAAHEDEGWMSHQVALLSLLSIHKHNSEWMPSSVDGSNNTPPSRLTYFIVMLDWTRVPVVEGTEYSMPASGMANKRFSLLHTLSQQQVPAHRSFHNFVGHVRTYTHLVYTHLVYTHLVYTRIHALTF